MNASCGPYTPALRRSARETYSAMSAATYFHGSCSMKTNQNRTSAARMKTARARRATDQRSATPLFLACWCMVAPCERYRHDRSAKVRRGQLPLSAGATPHELTLYELLKSLLHLFEF